MKHILIFTSALLLGVTSCKETNTKSNDIQVSTKNVVKTIVVDKPVEMLKTTGSFIERYDNGNLKTEGWRNSSSQRDGIWYSYYEHGSKWSAMSYNNGIKEGQSVVYFPNAKIHYKGQYKNDKKAGTWIFYTENGDVKNEEKY